MLILQSVMAKSGNFWLYKIIQSFFKHYEIVAKNFIQSQDIYQEVQNWDLSFKGYADIDVINIEPKKVFFV